MNFFAHQDRARKQSKYLVLLFILAVICIVIAVDAVVLLLSGYLSTEQLADTQNIDNWTLIIWSSAGVIGLIVLSSLFKTAALRSGGAAVARSMGATQIYPGDTDHLHQRLLNVVEEVALASGTPVPDVFVMEQEAGINAFAAGFESGDAAIAVTRGCLLQLNREELQGVIAHEFSHILNGDMRLNIRLMGVLFGILVISIIGRQLSRIGYYSSFSSSREKGSGASIALIGFAIMAVGFIGLFFGRLIKAAISRQREFLADASAVQFTRNPRGISDALKKIGGYSSGSYLEEAGTEEVSHMLFSSGLPSLAGLFATHPPLEERILAIEPSFQGFDSSQKPSSTNAVPDTAQGFSAGTDGGSRQWLNHIGTISQPALDQSKQLHQSFQPQLQGAAHHVDQAPLLLFSCLMSEDAIIQKKQLDLIELSWGTEAIQAVKALFEQLQHYKSHRIPLLELAFPQLKRRSLKEQESLLKLVDKLIRADGQIQIDEYAIGRLLKVQLKDALQPDSRQENCELTDHLPALVSVLSVMAGVGAVKAEEVQHSFQAGLKQLNLSKQAHFALPGNWVAAMDDSLDRLDCLAPMDKEKLIAALVATVEYDHRITISEQEMLKAICGSLHCPVPINLSL